MVFAKLINKVGGGGLSSSCCKGSYASSSSPSKGSYARVSTPKNAEWLAQQGFEPPIIELDQDADRESLARFLIQVPGLGRVALPQ